MKPFSEVFSEIYQSRLRVLLEVSFSDHALKQQIMSEIYRQAEAIYQRDPSALSADMLADIARAEISRRICVPTGMGPSCLMRRMSEEEQQTAVLLFEKDKTQKEIAEELGIPEEKAGELVSSVKSKIEDLLKYTDTGAGITAAGFMIGMMKAFPANAGPVPYVIEAGMPYGTPIAMQAGASYASSSVSAASSSAVSAGSAGGAAQASAVYTAANTGPAVVSAAGGMSAAKIAAAAAITAAAAGGGYGIYRIVSTQNKTPEPVPEIIEESVSETSVPEEIIIEETEEPEKDAAAEWLGEWTADSGESLDIYSVNNAGMELRFTKYIETGELNTYEYYMEFDDPEKKTASEIGGPADHGGWEYTFCLEDGYITVKSRYPDLIFYEN